MPKGKPRRRSRLIRKWDGSPVADAAPVDSLTNEHLADDWGQSSPTLPAQRPEELVFEFEPVIEPSTSPGC